jgi:glycosyltransferase involved in cell wall biosynthesis
MWPETLVELGGVSKKHPFVRLMRRLADRSYRHSDRVVSLLPAVEPYLLRHGMKAEAFAFIPNGVATDQWDENVPLPAEHKTLFDGLPADHMVAGYFGGHALSNALDTLLDTAQLTLRQPVSYVLVGSGVEKPRLQEEASRRDLTNTLFLPPVPKTAVPALLAEFDCVYLTAAKSPLYRFGISFNKMYDSMMAGKPIICAIDAPCTPVEQFGCGLMVPGGHPGEAARAVRKLLDMGPEGRQLMGRRGTEAIMTEFSYDVLARRFLDLLHE